MRCRVWGAVGDRLIELVPEGRPPGSGLVLEGLPPGLARTTAERVRAALLNSGVLKGDPSVGISLRPGLGHTDHGALDVPIALAVLVGCSKLGRGLRWVYGSGRVGLDGHVATAGNREPRDLAQVVQRVRVSGGC